METLIPIYGINQDWKERFLWEIFLTEEKHKWFQKIMELMDEALKYYPFISTVPKTLGNKIFLFNVYSKTTAALIQFLQLCMSKLSFS